MSPDKYPDGAVILDGLDGAIIGVEGNCLVYDNGKIVDQLMWDSDMTRGEAIEYLSFNIWGLYAGPTTPIFKGDV